MQLNGRHPYFLTGPRLTGVPGVGVTAPRRTPGLAGAFVNGGGITRMGMVAGFPLAGMSCGLGWPGRLLYPPPVV